MSRPATPDDVDGICMSLPEVEFGTTWGDRPTYKVPIVTDAWATRAPKRLVKAHFRDG